MEIAHRDLIPRQLTECGLDPAIIDIQDDALRGIISGFTREAGLRQLERAIGKVARKIALRFAEGKSEPVTVTAPDLHDMLGPEKNTQEKMRQHLPPGVVAGLAWTEAGGEVLYVEAALLPDAQGLTMTGQLGDVMQESAKAAQSFLWSHAEEFGIDPALFRTHGLHIHVPAGSIPKDGPSAGVTMATAIASASGYGHDRRDYADRSGPAHRRSEGEGARRAARRNSPHHFAQGQWKGSARSTGSRPRG